MRSTSDLRKLRLAFQGRLRRIRESYSTHIEADGRINGKVLSFSVIELDNLVVSTIRYLTISTFRKARTATGHRISVNVQFQKEDEIAAYMLSIVQPYTYTKMSNPSSLNRRQEPKIRDPRDTEKIFSAAGASNLGSLQNALALNTTLFSNLATVRNFYAHRNDDTWRKVRNLSSSYGIIGLRHPDHFVTHVAAGRPVSVFTDWLDDAELFFTEATE